MPDLSYLQAKALRIRSAVESLTDADDLAVVRDYPHRIGAPGSSAGS
jgi:hypothetical protein